MNKIIAKQVPPEWQESPLFYGDEFFPENVLIFGNCQYKEHIPAHIENLVDRLNILGYNMKKLCRAISLYTGENWDYQAITGCAQSEWNYFVYPVDEWTPDAIRTFETEYFNTGTEWTIDDNGDTYNMYCTAWNNDGIRAQIADAHGCASEDIVLLEFDGWTRTPSYKAVTV